MKESISVLIKPASSLCNLRCRYCFYSDVSQNRSLASTGIMDEETTKILVDRIAEKLGSKGEANVSFQGGEPTMAGLDYFRNFVSLFKNYPEIEVHYSMQTNGTKIDEEWAKFFKENDFLLGISLDGYQSNMDKFRYDPLKRGVFYQVLSGIDELNKAKVDYNILTVVTSDLAKHAKGLYDFYRSHHFEYIQLIPCLPGLSDEGNDMALTPKLYEKFFKEFFDCWEEGYQKGVFMNINLFENLAGMLKGYPPYQCGMLGRCIAQYVIEANGDVYPCDFYCLDEYLLGNLKERSFLHLSESKQKELFMEGSECKKKPCENCEFIRICNGGCRRQNICYLTDEYCAYEKVLEQILPRIYNIIS